MTDGAAAANPIMKIAKNPPQFSLKKNYDDYKNELEVWSKVTTIEKGKWGMIIALGLPENGECEDIRNKVFRGCDLNGEAGYQNYIKFMDKHFKKESISDMCEAIRSFMKMCKSEEQTIADYLSTFDSMYNRACTKGLTELPQAYLMFLVLENAHLEVQDYRLVLPSIDFTPTSRTLSNASRAVGFGF